MATSGGAGTFDLPDNYDVGDIPTSVIAARLNPLESIDLAVVNHNWDSVSVRLNIGVGIFPTIRNFVTADGPWSVCAADFDTNGYLDLATANLNSHNVSVLLNDQTQDTVGKFDTHAEYAVGNKPISIATGDFNGDGFADLVTANSGNYSISVLINDRDGTFAAAVRYVTDLQPHAVCVADFDCDGHLDVATANWGPTPGTVSVLINDGEGAFGARDDYNVTAYPWSIYAGDLRSCSNVDVVAVPHVLWSSDEQAIAIFDNAADMIGQTAIGERYVLASLEHDYLGILGKPSGSRGR